MQLQLDNNKKELKSHGTYAFPVNVSYEQLSRYERKSFLWHWHKEIELTILLQGEMQYQVNDTIYHLQAGEGLFCNSNRLHTGSSCHDSDCIYISTTFHPRFLYGYEDSVIQNKYLNTITKHPGLHSLAFSPDIPWQKEVLDHDTIDLRCLEQLADQEQIQALSAILCYAERRLFNGKDTLQQIIDRLDTELSDRGLEILSEGGRLAPNLAMPRIQEVYACINRYRGLKI